MIAVVSVLSQSLCIILRRVQKFNPIALMVSHGLDEALSSGEPASPASIFLWSTSKNWKDPKSCLLLVEQNKPKKEIEVTHT